ncbi:Lactonase, 7-bladed beta-propeller [Prolinoborus fasciculus]|nr:beta-propeller fold lactonase family protein [Prolinoborus fasciculus]ENX27045.1 hypothetical protein F891_01998 [Acinetobacter sp. CIP 101966]SPJ19470.1 Lactonase, 7-bladed beta-propeller [Prolinoborus fasciculus]
MLFRRAILSVSIVLLMSGCGGGGSDSSTSQPTGPDSMTSPSTGEQLSKIAEFKVLDVGSELTAGNFGLKTWNPTAMVVNGDVLYIANSQAESNILRYDLKQKRALSAIDPTKISGLAKKWDSLNDLEIQAGRLYVANYGSNRIDVLDINSEQPNFIMALGTGVWWGDALNYALVHSNAVTADDRYVYVPDIEGRINVWRQSDVTAQNHLKARKFARLSLPGCARNCNARMEVMGDYLYTSLPDGMTYVHDINQIQENGNNITPILTETNLSAVMHRHNDGLVYVSRNDGTVESYKEKSFNLESILPNKSVDTFRDYILKGQNQSSRLAKASDLYIYGQNLLHMANQKIHILPMLTLQQNKSTQLNQAMILTESKARERSRVLQDGESWETLTNSSQRYVYMDKILSATLNGNRLHLKSYSAVPVRDLQIRAKIKNSEDWVILAKLDQLTPFSNASFDLKLTDQSRFPLLDGTGSIQLAGLSQTTQNPSNIFDLKISSETDEHVKS